MSKELRVPKLEPRTWAIREEQQAAVHDWLAVHKRDMERMVGRFREHERRKLDRLWRKIHRYVPEVRGINCKIDINRNGKAFIEEVIQ